MRKASLIVVMMLLSAGCEHKRVPIPAPPAAPTTVLDPGEQDRLAKQATTRLVEDTMTAFSSAVVVARGKCSPFGPDCGMAARVVFDKFRTLAEVIDTAAKTIDVAKYQGHEYDSAKVSLATYDNLAQSYAEYERNPPKDPSKPSYNPPAYHGSFPFSGTYRAEYNGGGVVIEVGGNLFVIEGVTCINGFGGRCSIGGWFDGGYEEATGRTITLNVGRYGRSAKVLKSVDHETYDEDQAEYRSEVGAAKAKYAREMKDYQDALANNAAAKAKHAADKVRSTLVANKLSGDIGAYYNAVTR